MMIRRTLIAAASAAIVLGSAGAAMAVSGATTTSAPAVIHGCVNAQTHVLTQRAGRHCHAGTTALNWNVTGPQGPAGAAGATGPAGPAGKSFQPTVVTAVFTLANRPDSGSGGNNWAADNITRTATVTEHGSVPAADCGSASTTGCHFYTMTISDTGTFTTQPGLTPNQGCTEPTVGTCAGLNIQGTVTGTLSGGGTQEFYADTTPAAPSVLSYSGSDPTSTTGWYKLFFGNSTNFGLTSASQAPWTNWGWGYDAPSTCETWFDTEANGGGSGSFAAIGNIAGVNQCTS